MIIYLAEFQGHNGTSLTTYRFSSGLGYADTVNGNYYEPRIQQPALMRRDILDGNLLGGASGSSYGEMTLINADGGLNALRNVAVDGRTLTLLVGNDTDAYSSFSVVLKITLSHLVFEREIVSLRIHDRQSDMAKPVQANYYTGTNVLPAGIDGTDDIKGRNKPKIYGRVTNISPELVNTSQLIYQVNDGPISDIVCVLDKGAYLGREADYATQADMENLSPSAGYFRVWPAGGLFRIGSSPAGQMTATVWETSTAEEGTAAQLIYRLATEQGGVSPSNTVASDYTTLDGQNAGGCGLVATDMTVADAISTLCLSVGAWWGFDAQGRFRVFCLDAPSGSPVTTLIDGQIIDMQTDHPVIEGSISPVYKITLGYDPNWTVQNASDLAGVVPADRAAWLSAEYRYVKVENTSIQAISPSAKEIKLNTVLLGASYASPEASRLLALLDRSRRIHTVTAYAELSVLLTLDLGVCVQLNSTKMGINQMFRVIGIQTDYQRGTVDLRLWG